MGFNLRIFIAGAYYVPDVGVGRQFCLSRATRAPIGRDIMRGAATTGEETPGHSHAVGLSQHGSVAGGSKPALSNTWRGGMHLANVSACNRPAAIPRPETSCGACQGWGTTSPFRGISSQFGALKRACFPDSFREHRGPSLKQKGRFGPISQGSPRLRSPSKAVRAVSQGQSRCGASARAMVVVKGNTM